MIVFLLTLFASFNLAFGQTMLPGGELPLYHDKPRLLEDLVSGNPNGARANNIQTVQDAAAVAKAGVELGKQMMNSCTNPPPGNPVSCGIAMAAFQTAAQAAGQSGEADGLQQRLSIDGNSALMAEIQQNLAEAQAQLANLKGKGYNITPDGGTFTAPGSPPVEFSFNDLASDQTLLDKGVTQDQIDGVKAVIDDILKEGRRGPIVDSGMAGRRGNFVVPVAPDGRLVRTAPPPDSTLGETDNDTMFIGGVGNSTPDRGPASTDPMPVTGSSVDGLSVNFKGTPIGVSGGNMFKSVSNIYQRQGLE